MPPATDEDYPAAPSTPLRIYGSWDDENKENIDPKWGPKTGGDPSKRGTRTLRKLRKTKLADAASNAGNVDEAGSPRSVLDFKAAPAPTRKAAVRTFDIYDDALDAAAPVAAR